MLEKLKQMARRRRGDGADIDPSVFDDPLALETGWHPAAPGGASFGTHRLRQTSANRVEFVPTAAWKLFYLLFLLVGSGVLAFRLNLVRLGRASLWNEDVYVPLIVGAVFSVVGFCMWFFGSTPRVFDQTRGMFWRGRMEPAMMASISSGWVARAGTGGRAESAKPLSAIHALQLISEYVSGDKSSYYSYELNLVLADASRINVVDHGNLKRLHADAQTLAQFLNKPIWDATSH